jgi:hypothetical protein
MAQRKSPATVSFPRQRTAGLKRLRATPARAATKGDGQTEFTKRELQQLVLQASRRKKARAG